MQVVVILIDAETERRKGRFDVGVKGAFASRRQATRFVRRFERDQKDQSPSTKFGKATSRLLSCQNRDVDVREPLDLVHSAC